ncbi:hypothetical protein WJX72_000903 [[Myrmecia] bisecta]|uniref:SET domain-containing protein n=1 Tax=[Myrmecia] bisecta TaxID=41462 RepID=A0AAW1Q6G1_9CHLO
MASAAQTAAASKKNKKKGKKFVALPSLESCEAQLPWKLAFTQRLGRHAVAKTNLPAGSLVLREAAVGSVVLEQCAAFVCHSCLQELPDSDQPAHTAVVDCKASQFHRFCDRACQREFMASRPAWVARVYATQLQELAGIADSNIHSLGTGSRNQEIAVGLFPALSMLNHSCSPNCCFQATGKEMAVRTTRDVKAGEQLCVSYINLFEMRPVRQRQLLATKFFRCQCERCAQPLPQSTDRFLEGVQCSARGCRGLLLAQDPGGEDHTPWKCDTCAVEVPAVNAEGTGPQNIVNKATIIWQRNMAVMQHQGHAMAKAMFEDLLKEFDRPGKLQRLHMVLFDSLVPLMNCCRAAGDTAGAISYLSKVTAAMEELHVTPNSPELANYLTLHGMLLADRANGAPAAFKARLKKQAKETLARAAAMRKICLGPEHPATLDALDKIRQV